MPWLILLLAGFLEICWAAGLKYSNGLTNLRWTAFTAVTLIGSMVLLAQAVRTLPLGTAYAVWTGIGAAGTAILGIVLFGDAPHDPAPGLYRADPARYPGPTPGRRRDPQG